MLTIERDDKDKGFDASTAMMKTLFFARLTVFFCLRKTVKWRSTKSITIIIWHEVFSPVLCPRPHWTNLPKNSKQRTMKKSVVKNYFLRFHFTRKRNPSQDVKIRKNLSIKMNFSTWFEFACFMAFFPSTENWLVKS